MLLKIKDYRAISWNTYLGLHHQARTAPKNFAKMLVREQIDPNAPPFNVSVTIKVLAYYKHHPVDSDNVCAKPLIDALKDFVIVDDDIVHVTKCTTESILSNVDEVHIIIEPTQETKIWKPKTHDSTD